MASSEDDVLNSEPEMEEDDLFGDEADEEPKADEQRELDDEELDSGDDENRDDRKQKRQEDLLDEGVTHDLRIVEQTVSRHPLPKPVDGEVCLCFWMFGRF
jgi:RNA polymerase-associated protein LEO1